MKNGSTDRSDFTLLVSMSNHATFKTMGRTVPNNLARELGFLYNIFFIPSFSSQPNKPTNVTLISETDQNLSESKSLRSFSCSARIFTMSKRREDPNGYDDLSAIDLWKISGISAIENRIRSV